MESAAKTAKRVTLELGGKYAAIVMPDVDLDEVAQRRARKYVVPRPPQTLAFNMCW